MVSNIETIAELQQRVSDLEQQLACYRSVINQMSLGIHMYHLEDPDDDTTLRMIDANPAVEQLTGIGPEQIIGHTLDENFPDLRSQGVPQLYANVIRASESASFEVVYGDEHVIESAFAVHAMPLPGNCLAVSFDNITQRKQAEQEILQLNARLEQQVLSQTEELHRAYAALNQAADPIYWADQTGRFVYVNTAACTDLGYTRAELLDLNFADIDANSSPTIVQNMVQTLVQQGKTSFETVHRRKDGSLFPVEMLVCQIVLDDSSFLSCFAHDITGRKQAENALRTAKQQMEQIFAATPLASIEFGLDGRITGWNSAAERIFGWSAAEAIGQELLPLLVPSAAMGHVETVRDNLFQGQFANSQNENVTRDGRIITCRWHNTVMLDTIGQVIGVLSQTEDITEQVEQERELRIFRTLVESAPYSISIANPSGVLTYANLAHQHIHGYQASTVGLRFADLMPNAIELQHALTSLATKGRWHGLMTHQRIDGSRFPMQCDAFFVYNQDGVPTSTVVIERDMSDDVRQEQERLILQQQVIDAQQSALRELSTPLIPLADHVLVMPLIGTIDRIRAQQVMEALLEGIAIHQASVVIVDITGVRVVDTQVAQGLMQTARAVRLLGAQVVLTGIQPQIAQTLVSLGADLSGIVTRGTLQAGIAYALSGERVGW